MSPLTGGPADKVGAVRIADIRQAYQSAHGIDVSGYLPAIDALDLYACGETGLQFFAPGDLTGPPAFYEALYSGEGADWGYQESKWEFDCGARLVAGAQSVLDVGSGGGDFLEKLKVNTRALVGLETSALGRSASSAKGLDVRDQTIGDHAAAQPEAYDAVTAFQVLEHVSDPAAFLRGCVDVLKPGGVLVISVPNNDAFLRHCKILPLNLPPHHVTLWSRRPLEALSKLFPIDLFWLEKEPLQPANLDWYQSVMEQRYLPKSRIVRSLYYRLGGAKAFRKYLDENHLTIDGHTILAAYRKRARSE